MKEWRHDGNLGHVETRRRRRWRRAALGALLRWHLGNRLNALFPVILPGTLAANLIGGYLIGLALAFFSAYPAISLE